MVIQRWQSLLLFLATVCMVVYIFLPAQITDIETQQVIIVDPKYNLGLWIPAAVSALLYCIAIFLFKNFAAQLWTLFAANGCAIISGALLIWATMPDTIAWTLVFPLAALILGMAARGFIRKDRATLRSYDRLR
ncbi:MAG: DUF4293 domain-containing protein [Candidatus Amulumruptor caecigallinarius]|nr:DUF4293 domain-containing protein [Candidatus Amulumruptor caecigallinarius]MCM1396783.1 DUF4293 domain-containing protein [Candidatus Amulumruptor caecigallinarius]MCM1454522.1 DUF4293 domain-containing protein [bacterium]